MRTVTNETVVTKPVEPEPSPTTSTSRGPRPIPPPWLDCEHCGWRHYPDISIRFGNPRHAVVCAQCGEALPAAPDEAA